MPWQNRESATFRWKRWTRRCAGKWSAASEKARRGRRAPRCGRMCPNASGPLPTPGATSSRTACVITPSRSCAGSTYRAPFNAYAEAITWHLNTDDAFWERLHRHFSEPELVELGCFIALTMGQQSWLRLLNIEHHQVLAGTSASMAPGFEDARALAETKASAEYWAKSGEVDSKKVA